MEDSNFTVNIERISHGGNRICLINFRLSGHHPLYLSCFVQSFLELGNVVDIYSPEISECREKLLEVLPSLDFSNINFVHTSASTYRSKRLFGCRSFFNLIKLQQEIELQEHVEGFCYELVFFAFLDDVAHVDFILPYLFKLPFTKMFSGLLIDPHNRVLKNRSFVSKLLTTSLIEREQAKFHEIGLLVEDVQAEVEKKIRRKTILYPDFCLEIAQDNVDSLLKKQLTSRKKGRIVTGLFGSIFPHKSLDLLLECVEKSNSDLHFFIIAGKIQWSMFSSHQEMQIKKYVMNSPENLLICDEWIESEAVFDSVFQMCDVIFAYYRDFIKSSNILTKSAFYRIPVIVNDKHLMGERVRRYNLGYAKSEADVVEMYRNDNWHLFHFDEKLLKEYTATHTVRRIPEIFTKLLEKPCN